MGHVVEVDQSIKIEESKDTVLAFADGITFAVVIPSGAKQAGFLKLKLKGKSREVALSKLFSASLYLLLRDDLHLFDRIVIDVEYTGKDATIRSYLMEHIRLAMPCFEPDQIVFEQVGKDSPADRKARAVRLKLDQGYRTVTTEEMLELL